MIASIVWDVDPILFKVGSWEVRWYGLMWGLGFILDEIRFIQKKRSIRKTGWTSFSFHVKFSTVIGAVRGRLFKKKKYPEDLEKVGWTWRGFAIILALMWYSKTK